MSKAITIITRSLRILSVIASGESPTAAEVNDALQALNELMTGLLADTDTPHVPYTANSELTTPLQYDLALAEVLAEIIAVEYERTHNSGGFYGQLLAGVRKVKNLDFDPALTSFNQNGNC